MPSQDFIEAIAPRNRSLKIIWVAIMAACLFYVFLAWLFTTKAGVASGASESTGDGQLELFAEVAGVILLASSFLVRRIMLSPARLATHLQRVPSAANLVSRSYNQSVDPELAARFGRLSTAEQRLTNLAGPLASASIVAWAMREALAVIGLVLVIMEHSFAPVVPLAGVALVALLLTPPRPLPFYAACEVAAQRIG